MLHSPPIPHVKQSGSVAVRADIWPATVQFSFGPNPYAKTRAILTADAILVLIEAGRNAAVLYEGRLENVDVKDRKNVIATTADGTITISRAAGCGCGSSMRSYRPFGRAVSMASR